MKILHTSDWHLGRTLYAQKERTNEHRHFLQWLINIITTHAIDLVLIAGDIFDTAAPNSTSQKMYYDFLLQVRQTTCRDVIVVGGNHDSPSFLNAPKDLLAALRISVVGDASGHLADHIFVIKNSDHEPQIIVCAVPFLRERDVSRFVEGEQYADRSERINEGIKKHYYDIASKAQEKRQMIGKAIPIIATGHLSVMGGKRSEDDGVRETYIGNIGVVHSDIFPDIFDYVALGHYHSPSIIQNHIRYCGSPIQIGFGEAGQSKCVYVIDFTENKKITTIDIPIFQQLVSIKGDKKTIAQQLDFLKEKDESVWVDVTYNGQDIFTDFTLWAQEQIAHTKIEILKLQNLQRFGSVMTQHQNNPDLKEVTPNDVFDKRLELAKISDEQKNNLRLLYQEIMLELNAQN